MKKIKPKEIYYEKDSLSYDLGKFLKEKYHDITGGETIGKITWFENEKKVTKKNITWKLEKALPCGMEEKFTVKL